MDEFFLNNRIKQRIVVFMAEGTDMNPTKYDKHDVAVL